MTVPTDWRSAKPSQHAQKWWSYDGRPIDLSQLQRHYGLSSAPFGSELGKWCSDVSIPIDLPHVDRHCDPSADTFYSYLVAEADTFCSKLISRTVAFRFTYASSAEVNTVTKFPDLPVQGFDEKSPSFSISSASPVQTLTFGIPRNDKNAKKVKRFTLKLGIADGHWKSSFKTEQKEYGSSGPGDREVNFFIGPHATNDGGIILSIVHRADKLGLAYRLVALDKSGNTIIAGVKGTSEIGDAGDECTEFEFRKLALPQVRYFDFQTRPYTWLEFKDIAFNPR